MDALKPRWLQVPVSGDSLSAVRAMRETLSEHGLRTVCTSARCPNLPTCWGQKTATFLLLGATCTRSCRFCAVATGWPDGAIDASEPERVGRAAAALGLQYVVLTSVDRDDLPDGGSSHFASTIRAVTRHAPMARTEALIPDFGGNASALGTVVAAGPSILGHNLETVERLTPRVRDPKATYARSLDVLKTAKRIAPGLPTKSSLLLGLGETAPEIEQALDDLRSAEVDVLVLGQYLRPSPAQLPVVRHVHPDEFDAWGVYARGLGFGAVVSGPLVRTSFRAHQVFEELQCG